MNARHVRIAAWLLRLGTVAAGSALVVDLLDRHRDGLAGAVLVPLGVAWLATLVRAWRQRAWLWVALLVAAPVVGVAAWAVVALQAALAAA